MKNNLIVKQTSQWKGHNQVHTSLIFSDAKGEDLCLLLIEFCLKVTRLLPVRRTRLPSLQTFPFKVFRKLQIFHFANLMYILYFTKYRFSFCKVQKFHFIKTTPFQFSRYRFSFRKCKRDSSCKVRTIFILQSTDLILFCFTKYNKSKNLAK